MRQITTDDFTTFAGRLTALHRRIADPSTGAPFARQHIATEVGVSMAYISQLFSGSRTNPSTDVQERLAACLGLQSVEPLRDATASTEAARELDLLSIMQDRGLTSVMTRIAEWPKDRIAALEAMMEIFDRERRKR